MVLKLKIEREKVEVVRCFLVECKLCCEIRKMVEESKG